MLFLAYSLGLSPITDKYDDKNIILIITNCKIKFYDIIKNHIKDDNDNVIIDFDDIKEDSKQFTYYNFLIVPEQIKSDYYGFELDGDGIFTLWDSTLTHNSSLTHKLTGIKTQKHSSEKEQNKTIKLGYANSKIYKCLNCNPPECYQAFSSNIMNANCRICNSIMELKRHISFVDCPGHNMLMATMLNGTCIMDSTIMVESVENNTIPSAQTLEHYFATKIINLKNNFICMNKIDLVDKNTTLQKIDKLKEFIKNNNDMSKIVPISTIYDINIDIICEYLCNNVPESNRDYTGLGELVIVRSFNINKQNTKIKNLEGGVIGGSILKGKVKVGNFIKIIPGIVIKNEDNDIKQKWKYKPLITKVTSINSEKNDLNVAYPGGLIGIKTTLDPSLTAKDRLIGNYMVVLDEDYCNKNSNKHVFDYIDVKYKLIIDYHTQKKITKLRENDELTINCNASNIKCLIKKKDKKIIRIKMVSSPICISLKEKITISKEINKNIRLIGIGTVINGSKLPEF